jgi:two-component system, OmpR family, heavy metal sensor histidine kinase CusS
MIISFRTRLFVIAGVIVGTVLGAVMVLGWSRVLAYEVQRLDGRLCMEARRLATQPFHGEDLPRLQADIMGKLQVGNPEHLMLGFEANSRRTNSQSSDGATAFSFDSTRWQLAENQSMAASPNGRSKRLEPPERSEPPERPPARREGEPMVSTPLGACALASFESQGRQWRGARFGIPPQRSTVMVDLAVRGLEAGHPPGHRPDRTGCVAAFCADHAPRQSPA